MLAGNLRVIRYVDDGATPEQEAALLAAFRGEKGGPLADLAQLVGEEIDARRAPITFTVDEGKGTLKIGDVVQGTVTKITSFGAFVELKDGIDGLVHISQISEERIEKVKDILKPGQQVTARVIKIDRDERRLGLSIKAANYSADQLAAETASYDALNRDSSGDMMNLGDILDEAAKKE